MILNYQIKIFEGFLANFRRELTGSFIAKKNKLNQKTVANYLNYLEKEHILKSRREGRNKLYRLNENNKEIVKHFIIAIEHLRTIEFYNKNSLIKEVSEKILPYIKGITVIFGSYAKGNANSDSDLDILIIGKANEKAIDKISEMFNIEINPKIYPKIKHDILIKEVTKNHIIIKNTEQWVEALINE